MDMPESCWVFIIIKTKLTHFPVFSMSSVYVSSQVLFSFESFPTILTKIRTFVIFYLFMNLFYVSFQAFWVFQIFIADCALTFSIFICCMNTLNVTFIFECFLYVFPQYGQ